VSKKQKNKKNGKIRKKCSKKMREKDARKRYAKKTHEKDARKRQDSARFLLVMAN